MTFDQKKSQSAKDAYERKVRDAIKDLGAIDRESGGCRAMGKDYPMSEPVRRWNKPRECTLVTESRDGGSSTQVFRGWRYKYSLESQNPNLSLQQDGITITLYSANFLPDDGLYFRGRSVTFDELAPEIITRIFVDEVKVLNLNAVDAAYIADSGKPINEQDTRGLELLGWTHCGTVAITKASEDVVTTPGALALFSVLKGTRPRITLVRKTHANPAALDIYWKHRIQVCATRGDYPFFRTENVTISRFEKWFKNPAAPLTHQSWMALVKQLDDGYCRYASHAIKKHFSSLREWEIVLSVGLILETIFEEMCRLQYYNWGIFHDAKVILNKGRYIQLEFTIQRLDQHAKPPTTVGMLFKLRFGGSFVPTPELKDSHANEIHDNQVQDKGAEDDEADGTVVQSEGDRDVDMTGTGRVETPAQTDDGMDIDKDVLELQARVVDTPTESDFVLSLQVATDADADKFKLGGHVKIELKMLPSFLPATRQLVAIASIAHKTENAKPNIIQNLILGNGAPILRGYKSTLEEANSVPQEIKDIFEAYVCAGTLNLPQRQAWEDALMSRHPVIQIQGPPGTGKTLLDVNIAISSAILGNRVVMTAPSNKACDAIMKSVTAQMEKLSKLHSKGGQVFKVVYFPTEVNLAIDLQFSEHNVHDFVESGDADIRRDTFSKHKLYAMVIRSFKDIVAKPASKEAKTHAADWLQTLDDVRNKHRKDKIRGVVLRKFLKDGQERARIIMADPSIRLVVTTASNSAQLSEIDFNVDLLIMDECAFASEQDSCVPLALYPSRIVLSGDQKQLRIIVRSNGHNEFALQKNLSLFERILGQDGIPLYRLKINYRMHPELARFPGQMSYGWLGCGENTSVESSDYKYMEHFWRAGFGQNFQAARRQPEFARPSQVANASMRRIFFNVTNGHSAVGTDSSSLVNYGNVETIARLCCKLLDHFDTSECARDMGDACIDMRNVVIATLYAEERHELERSVQLMLGAIGYKKFPRIVGVDSFQGDESDVIILSLTPANPRHGSRVGFTKDFHRLNVAITRAKSVLWMVGNLDAWRSELKILAKDFRGREMALMVMDLVSRGDIVDVAMSNRLPVTTEQALRDPAEWTRLMPTPATEVLNEMRPGLAAKAEQYKKDIKAREAFEAKLMKELRQMSVSAEAFELQFQRIGDFQYGPNAGVKPAVRIPWEAIPKTFAKKASANDEEFDIDIYSDSFHPEAFFNEDTASQAQLEAYRDFLAKKTPDEILAWTLAQHHLKLDAQTREDVLDKTLSEESGKEKDVRREDEPSSPVSKSTTSPQAKASNQKPRGKKEPYVPPHLRKGRPAA